MANLYRVVTNKVYKSTNGKIRSSAGETVRYISATSDANASAAAETDDGSGTTSYEFTHHVQLVRPNVIAGS